MSLNGYYLSSGKGTHVMWSGIDSEESIHDPAAYGLGQYTGVDRDDDVISGPCAAQSLYHE